jgi:hypothetical protein
LNDHVQVKKVAIVGDGRPSRQSHQGVPQGGGPAVA